MDEKPREENKKNNEDYFSFFNSHEKLILKPESTFKNVSIFYYIFIAEAIHGVPSY